MVPLHVFLQALAKDIEELTKEARSKNEIRVKQLHKLARDMQECSEALQVEGHPLHEATIATHEKFLGGVEFKHAA